MKNTPVNCLLVASAALFVSVGGCSKESSEPAAAPAPRSTSATPSASPAPAAQSSATGSGATDTTTVKTMDEYRSDADKKITPANAETELSKLEKEIAADK